MDQSNPTIDTKEGLAAVRKSVETMVKFGYFNEAFHFIRDYESYFKVEKFEEEHPDLYEEYKKLIIKAKWIALHLLKDQEVEVLFENNFLAVFEIEDYDVWDFFKRKLIMSNDLDERNALKKKVWLALERNKEAITSKKIKISNEEVYPVIMNWLKDFVANVGLGQFFDNIKFVSYLTNSVNTRPLGEEEKKKLEILFKFYHRIHLSSYTLEGFEEDIPVNEENIVGIIRDGKFESWEKEIKNISQAKKPLKPESYLKATKAYQGDLREQKEILADQELIKQNFAKMPADKQGDYFLSIFKKGLDQRDKINVIAVLRLMAEMKIIDQLLTDKNISGSFIEYLKTKQQPSLVEGFKIHPAAPNYLALFLQYALQNRLMLNENDAGRVGMQLSNIFKKVGYDKYGNLVYFDMKDNRFRWNI